MRLSTYLAILIGINLVFYLAGYTPIGNQLVNQVITEDGSIDLWKITSSGDNYAGNTLEPKTEEAQSSIVGIMMMGIGVSFIILSLVIGFSALYVIPLVFVFAVVYLFIFPMSWILDPSMPEALIVIIAFLYNYLTFMAVLTFVRGQS
jgi:hypothetical protein